MWYFVYAVNGALTVETYQGDDPRNPPAEVIENYSCFAVPKPVVICGTRLIPGL
jgi:hypothetical protein